MVEIKIKIIILVIYKPGSSTSSKWQQHRVITIKCSGTVSKVSFIELIVSHRHQQHHLYRRRRRLIRVPEVDENPLQVVTQVYQLYFNVTAVDASHMQQLHLLSFLFFFLIF